MGRRTVRAAAAWADGLAGFTLDLDVAAIGASCSTSPGPHGPRPSAGARGSPRRSGSRCSTTATAARAQVHRHLRHYMSWLPAGLVDAMAPTTGFAGTAATCATCSAARGLGADEVHLIPTSSDISLVDEIAELAGQPCIDS